MTKQFGIIFLSLFLSIGNLKLRLIKFTVVPRAQKAGQYFFERGFNNCDIAYWKNQLGDNLKFYHDKRWLSGQKIILGKNPTKHLRQPKSKAYRKVIENSLEVFHFTIMAKYGAIQSGEHRFFIREKESGCFRWSGKIHYSLDQEK
jgi:hypothetical protein